MFKSKPVSSKLLKLIPPMGIILVIGSEGSGKSNLAYGILESFKDCGRKIFVYGLPLEKSKYLPDWIRICTDLNFPEESIVLADEAYLALHSRDSMKSSNKFMDIFSGLVRQKDILAIYVTQFSRKLDIGLVSAPRVLLIKQPSLLQMKLDRSELRSIITDAAMAFKELDTDHTEFSSDTAVNPKCLVATYVISDRFEGMINHSNCSPSFWSEELSKAWKGVSLLGEQLPDFRHARTLCCLCDEPAIGVCGCHGNSYCAQHAEGHKMLVGSRF